MRRFLLAFIITLTALRGFVGDAMAVEMLTQISAETTTEMTAQVASAGGQASAAPQFAAIDKNASMPCHTSAEDESAPSGGECQTCQVCCLGAFLPSALAPALVRLAFFAPLEPRESFLSAALPSLAKPPIS